MFTLFGRVKLAAEEGKVLTPSLFCFAIGNCLQIFVTANKKTPLLIDRITSY